MGIVDLIDFFEDKRDSISENSTVFIAITNMIQAIHYENLTKRVGD